MSTVMLKDQSYATVVELEQKSPSRLQQKLQGKVLDWLTSQSSLQSHWFKFKTMSAGPQVSYRVWSRHSAFLEVNSLPRKH